MSNEVDRAWKSRRVRRFGFPTCMRTAGRIFASALQSADLAPWLGAPTLFNCDLDVPVASADDGGGRLTASEYRRWRGLERRLRITSDPSHLRAP